jgi:hypothetical protein
VWVSGSGFLRAKSRGLKTVGPSNLRLHSVVLERLKVSSVVDYICHPGPGTEVIIEAERPLQVAVSLDSYRGPRLGRLQPTVPNFYAVQGLRGSVKMDTHHKTRNLREVYQAVRRAGH